MKEIYIVHVMDCTVCAYTERYAAIDHILSVIAKLTGVLYTGSTESELKEYLDNNCDVASYETLDLYDD